jgi:hypothetical protein
MNDAPAPWSFWAPVPSLVDVIIGRMGELTDTELRVALVLARSWTPGSVDGVPPANLARATGRGVDAIRAAVQGLQDKGVVVHAGGIAPPDWVRLNVIDVLTPVQGAPEGPGSTEVPTLLSVPVEPTKGRRKAPSSRPPTDNLAGPGRSQAEVFGAVCRLHGVNPSVMSQGTRFALANVAKVIREHGGDAALVEGAMTGLWRADWRSRGGKSRPSPAQIADLFGIAIQAKGTTDDSPASRAAKVEWRRIMAEWLAAGGIGSNQAKPPPFEEWFASRTRKEGTQ